MLTNLLSNAVKYNVEGGRVDVSFVERDGAESVLLAGTDLTMVMNESDAGVPALDCARVHIDAIVRRLLD